MTTPRLYLIAPHPLMARDVDACAHALEAGDVAALLLSGAVPVGEAGRDLLARAQAHNVAVLIADDPAEARRLGADGVHLAHGPGLAERYDGARAVLGSDAIVGVGVGETRHEAMVLGEKGADYLAFAALGGREGDRAARRARIAWWAELFEVPCVAWDVADIAEAVELARAGADFIALGAAFQAAAGGPVAALEAALRSAPRSQGRGKTDAPR